MIEAKLTQPINAPKSRQNLRIGGNILQRIKNGVYLRFIQADGCWLLAVGRLSVAGLLVQMRQCYVYISPHYNIPQHHHIVRLQLQKRKRIFACQKAKKKGVEENRTTSGTKIPLAMIITTPYIIQDWTVQ